MTIRTLAEGVNLKSVPVVPDEMLSGTARPGHAPVEVVPLDLIATSKSRLGWHFLRLNDGGRFRAFSSPAASPGDGQHTARECSEFYLSASTPSAQAMPGLT